MNFSEDEIKEFKVEAEELLELAEKSLLSLDKGEDFKLHYDAIFRAFHSIKGASGMMEMKNIQAHVHNLENMLTEQKNKPVLEKVYIDLFLRGSDATKNMLNGQEVEFDYSIKSKNEEIPVQQQTQVNESPVFFGRIFILNNEPEIVSEAVQILKDIQIEVHASTSSEAIFDIVDKIQPDAFVADITISNLDHLEIISKINSLYPDLPVIFIYNKMDKDYFIKTIQLGIFGIIEKPIYTLKFVELVINAIKNYKLSKLLNDSINLIKYQYSDLDEFLKSQNKEDIRKVLRTEIHALINKRRQLKEFFKK